MPVNAFQSALFASSVSTYEDGAAHDAKMVLSL